MSRGLQGFCVRVARGLNALADRKGSVFSERYHLRLLSSSWAWFDGWRDLSREQARLAAQERAGPAVVANPKSWLLRAGWRKRGLVRVDEVPSTCDV